MKKLCLSFLIIMLIAAKANAQDFIADSIRSVIDNAKSDSVKASALIELARHEYYYLNNHDTAIKLLNSTLAFAKQKGLIEQEVESIRMFGNYYFYTDDKSKDLVKAYLLTLQALSLARQHSLKAEEAELLLDLSINLGSDKTDSVELVIAQALSLSLKYNLIERQISSLARKASFYLAAKSDSAKFYFLQALALARKSNLPRREVSLLQIMANVYSNNHWGDSAKLLMKEALSVAKENNLADLEILVLDYFVQSRGGMEGLFSKDSLNSYYGRALLLNRKLHRDSLGLMWTFVYSWTDIGNFPKALQTELAILHVFEARKDTSNIQGILETMCELYWSAKDFKKSIEYCYEIIKYGPKDLHSYGQAYVILASDFLGLKQTDSARFYAGKAYQIALDHYHDPKKIEGGVLDDLGLVYFELGEDSIALDYLRTAYTYFTRNNNDVNNYTETVMGLAKCFLKAGLSDSSLYYAKLSFNISKKNGFLNYLSESGGLIADYYKGKHKIDSAYYYQQVGFEAYKTLYSDENSKQIQNMSFAEQQREQDVELAKKIAADEYRSRLKIYMLIGGLIILSLLAIGLWRRNIYRKKSFALLQEQKEQIQSTLTQLQSTQSQLIQSEKMASLGELTAGIAHEIQNPLNFVNNFSEVSNELIDEMKSELAVGNWQLANEIADDIKQNLEKINHHGKRADGIVKGMLQHSRSSTGVKELTDINALADEYLRLAFHGLRAKDNSFNAKMKTDFDESIGKINIIPQDIGRVLLNLYNNAFYAVNEKRKSANTNYDPEVEVQTRKEGNRIFITVCDNGNGIPKNIVDKIFQPFFTTKPTGEGTGLGLSLSYDIVKAHGGEIKVETREGEGAEFVIQLPV